MFVRAYLRASTEDQDATRARNALETFAKDHGVVIASEYVENVSGAKLERPELMRLLKDAKHGDVLLVEQVDRLSRLTEADWLKLRAMIEEKGVLVVALDLPTSHGALKPQALDDFTARMFKAINAMMLDMLAAVARKDYEDRRRRSAEGIVKARAAGKYKGRPVDTKQHETIRKLLGAGLSWNAVQEAVKCGRGTIATVAKQLKEAE
jgi:DNA invertase Pin-like site-specific DNA recombinase